MFVCKDTCVHIKVCIYAHSCVWHSTHANMLCMFFHLYTHSFCLHLPDLYLTHIHRESWSLTINLCSSLGSSPHSLHECDTCQLCHKYNALCLIFLVECITEYVISLSTFCAALFLLPSLALCNTCSLVFHLVYMVTCLSVSEESQPGLSSSCPWVFEPGWPGLAGANWRAEQTAWGESVWRSN